MSLALRATIVVTAVLALVALSLVLASELGEVVVLETRDREGAAHSTRLWVVEDQGKLWLRAGRVESGWYARLRQRPSVRLTRDGVTHSYRARTATTDAERERIELLMRQKYGVADRLISWAREPGSSQPVELAPPP